MKALYQFFEDNKDTDTFFVKVRREGNGTLKFRIYASTPMLGDVIKTFAADLPGTPIDFFLSRTGMTPADNRVIFGEDF